MIRRTLVFLLLIGTSYIVRSQDTWTQRAQSGGSIIGTRYQAVGFSINGKGYAGTGNGDPAGTFLLKDLWQYDPVTDQWTQKADFGGTARRLAVGFSIGSKGYIGTGDDGSVRNDFWEYDPVANTWTAKANFLGSARNNAVGFGLNGKGYIGTGVDGGGAFKNDFYEYDPATNSWSAKASLPAAGRNAAIGFSIELIGKGYIGTGFSDPGAVFYNDFYEYDPASDTWTPKANVGGPGRNAAVGVSIADRGYVGMGFGGGVFRDDFWEYDPATNQWLQKANMSGGARNATTAFNIGNDRCYVTLGYKPNNTIQSDIWEYKAWVPMSGNTIITGDITNCGPLSLIITGSTPVGGNNIYSYQWYSSTDNVTFNPIIGATNKDYNPASITQTTYFTRSVTSFYNQSSPASDTLTVTIYAQPTASYNISGGNAQCFSGNSFTFNNTSSIGSGTMTHAWTFGDGGTSNQTSPTHSYSAPGTYNVKLVVTSNNNCKDSVQQTVIVNPKPTAGFLIDDNVQCLNGNLFNFGNTSTLSSGTISFTWTFGDGGSSTDIDPAYSYTNSGSYNVTLIATSGNGCKDTVTHPLIVNPSPQAAFDVNNATQCFAGNSFSFSNNSSISLGTLTYDWDFGDATTSTQTNPTHNYTFIGEFVVTLIATSENGCKDTIKQTVTVNQDPSGTIVAPNGTFICDGGTILLQTASGSAYQWYLNGNAINAAVNATYNASQSGTYSVMIFNAAGCSAFASNTIDVVIIQRPNVDFTWDQSCLPGATQFSNLSYVPQGTPQYTWTFGDATQSNLVSPSHLYAQAGLYHVKLKLNIQGCPNSDSLQKDILVTNRIPGITLPTLNLIANTPQQLNERFLGNDYSIQWNPITGLSNSTILDPTTTLALPVTYYITQSSFTGCSTTDTLHVNLFDQSDIFVPKGFTPNGDGRNDVLRPILVGMQELKYFRVYNRWGNLVFETNTIGVGWDGKQKGKESPMESYTWVCEAITNGGASVKRSGTSTLIR